LGYEPTSTAPFWLIACRFTRGVLVFQATAVFGLLI